MTKIDDEIDELLLWLCSNDDLIASLWKRGVSPTEIADKMSFLSECRDADNLRAEMIEAAKCK